MNLQRKLAEIRRKPEHIRLRYTYAAVAVSMFFIFLLWIFSLSGSIKKTTIRKQNVFEGLDNQKKSLQEATTDVKKSLDDLNSNLQKTIPETTPTNTQSPPKDTRLTPPANMLNSDTNTTLPDQPLPSYTTGQPPLPQQ
jgi:hypothetical protein